MATFNQSRGKTRVVIRRKNKEMHATFFDRETAEIWAKYHEELIDNMENFQVPAESLITLEECCELKIKELKDKNVSNRSIEDIGLIMNDFKQLMDVPLSEITPNMVKEITNELLGAVIKRGGSKNPNTGLHRPTSPATVLRKLRSFSAVISYMIQNGAAITNPVQVVVNQVKMSLIKKGESLEDDEE